jgi:hypothetical protein
MATNGLAAGRAGPGPRAGRLTLRQPAQPSRPPAIQHRGPRADVTRPSAATRSAGDGAAVKPLGALHLARECHGSRARDPVAGPGGGALSPWAGARCCASAARRTRPSRTHQVRPRSAAAALGNREERGCEPRAGGLGAPGSGRALGPHPLGPARPAAQGGPSCRRTPSAGARGARGSRPARCRRRRVGPPAAPSGYQPARRPARRAAAPAGVQPLSGSPARPTIGGRPDRPPALAPTRRANGSASRAGADAAGLSVAVSERSTASQHDVDLPELIAGATPAPMGSSKAVASASSCPPYATKAVWGLRYTMEDKWAVVPDFAQVSAPPGWPRPASRLGRERRVTWRPAGRARASTAAGRPAGRACAREHGCRPAGRCTLLGSRRSRPQLLGRRSCPPLPAARAGSSALGALGRLARSRHGEPLPSPLPITPADAFEDHRV